MNDRKKLIKIVADATKGMARFRVSGIVDKLIAADVVSVVRCKDCKHCTLTKDGEYNPEDIVCDYFMTDGMQANDFCSYGERRENGT